jgi:hypothetical protein
MTELLDIVYKIFYTLATIEIAGDKLYCIKGIKSLSSAQINALKNNGIEIVKIDSPLTLYVRRHQQIIQDIANLRAHVATITEKYHEKKDIIPSLEALLEYIKQMEDRVYDGN